MKIAAYIAKQQEQLAMGDRAQRYGATHKPMDIISPARHPPEHMPGHPSLRRFAHSDRYGDMELLAVSQTSDGFLIGWARVHIGEECEHVHSIFLGK